MRRHGGDAGSRDLEEPRTSLHPVVSDRESLPALPLFVDDDRLVLAGCVDTVTVPGVVLAEALA